MDLDKFREQLRQEAREYLADLRYLIEDLKSREGWIAFALVVAATLIFIAWVIVSLGFNPHNDSVTAIVHSIGLRPCRTISNLNGVIVIVDFFLVFFLAIVTLGNVFNMMRRVRQGLPREPRDLIISASLMLIAGIGGIVFMLNIC